jgi:hypothetical protein
LLWLGFSWHDQRSAPVLRRAKKSSSGPPELVAINLAAVYVAPTGFTDQTGSEIMGLYANQFIKKG